MIYLKRAYEPSSENDGHRILVDRLWPRGLKKEAANIAYWAKGVAPSTTLRKWFNHEPQKWELFQLRYEDELKRNELVSDLIKLIKKNDPVTLLYAAHDIEHNHAIILKQFLESRIDTSD